MDSIISGLLATMPTGLWEKIIVAFENAFGSFALSIIVLTVIIKLIMSPIDFFNRRTNKKMATMQQKIQGQVEAINKKYANDSKTKNQKLGELYQREKINPISSCLTMLINLGLTFAIFITLLNGMNAMASYKITTEFETLQQEYVLSYVTETYSKNIYEEVKANPDKSVYEICKPYIDEMNAIENEETQNGVLAIANENVAKKHKEIKEGFLWIDNIWIADSPFQNSIPSFDSYAGMYVLGEIKRRKYPTKIIVITGFSDFEQGDKVITLSELNNEIHKKYESIYLGYIKYDSTTIEWQEKLMNLLSAV